MFYKLGFFSIGFYFLSFPSYGLPACETGKSIEYGTCGVSPTLQNDGKTFNDLVINSKDGRVQVTAIPALAGGIASVKFNGIEIIATGGHGASFQTALHPVHYENAYLKMMDGKSISLILSPTQTSKEIPDLNVSRTGMRAISIGFKIFDNLLPKKLIRQGRMEARYDDRLKAWRFVSGNTVPGLVVFNLSSDGKVSYSSLKPNTSLRTNFDMYYFTGSECDNPTEAGTQDDWIGSAPPYLVESSSKILGWGKFSDPDETQGFGTAINMAYFTPENANSLFHGNCSRYTRVKGKTSDFIFQKWVRVGHTLNKKYFPNLMSLDVILTPPRDLDEVTASTAIYAVTERFTQQWIYNPKSKNLLLKNKVLVDQMKGGKLGNSHRAPIVKIFSTPDGKVAIAAFPLKKRSQNEHMTDQTSYTFHRSEIADSPDAYQFNDSTMGISTRYVKVPAQSRFVYHNLVAIGTLNEVIEMANNYCVEIEECGAPSPSLNPTTLTLDAVSGSNYFISSQNRQVQLKGSCPLEGQTISAYLEDGTLASSVVCSSKKFNFSIQLPQNQPQLQHVNLIGKGLQANSIDPFAGHIGRLVLSESSPTNQPGQIMGYVDGINDAQSGGTKYVIWGWACDKGLNQSIDVELYTVEGNPNRERIIRRISANESWSSEDTSGLAKLCSTENVPHRFRFWLNANEVRALVGKSILVRGISGTNGPNLPLKQSGEFVFPTPP